MPRLPGQPKRTKKPPKETCTFNHHMAIEIEQSEARCIAHGNFLPRSVADKMVANIEALYRATESRERIARLGGAI